MKILFNFYPLLFFYALNATIEQDEMIFIAEKSAQEKKEEEQLAYDEALAQQFMQAKAQEEEIIVNLAQEFEEQQEQDLTWQDSMITEAERIEQEKMNTIIEKVLEDFQPTRRQKRFLKKIFNLEAKRNRKRELASIESDNYYLKLKQKNSSLTVFEQLLAKIKANPLIPTQDSAQKSISPRKPLQPKSPFNKKGSPKADVIWVRTPAEKRLRRLFRNEEKIKPLIQQSISTFFTKTK